MTEQPTEPAAEPIAEPVVDRRKVAHGTAVQCKACGRVVWSEDVDADGVCVLHSDQAPAAEPAPEPTPEA